MHNRELAIMKHLRTNARESLTRMSRKTGIPVSTIYERLKTFENTIIKKHTCLLDFTTLGYDLRVTILLQGKAATKERLQRFLETHHKVNTLLKINNGYDYLVEVLFKNMSEVQEFFDALDEIGIRNKKEFYVLDEVIREGFLTSDAHLKLLQQP